MQEHQNTSRSFLDVGKLEQGYVLKQLTSFITGGTPGFTPTPIPVRRKAHFTAEGIISRPHPSIKVRRKTRFTGRGAPLSHGGIDFLGRTGVNVKAQSADFFFRAFSKHTPRRAAEGKFHGGGHVLRTPLSCGGRPQIWGGG